jgi:hypothetical protein
MWFVDFLDLIIQRVLMNYTPDEDMSLNQQIDFQG